MSLLICSSIRASHKEAVILGGFHLIVLFVRLHFSFPRFIYCKTEMESAGFRTSLILGFHAGLCWCYPCDVPLRDLSHCYAVGECLYLCSLWTLCGKDTQILRFVQVVVGENWAARPPQAVHRDRWSRDHVDASRLLIAAAGACLRGVSLTTSTYSGALVSSHSMLQRFPRLWTSSQSRLHSHAYSLVSYTVAILCTQKTVIRHSKLTAVKPKD